MKKIVSFFSLICVTAGFLQASLTERENRVIEGYNPFEALPAEVILQVFEFLPDGTLAVTSCVDRRFRALSDTAANDRLRKDPESAWLLAYLRQGKYVSGLLQQNLISEVWHVLAGTAQTNIPLEPSWIRMSSKNLSLSLKSGHPLLDPTLKLLTAHEGKIDPISAFSNVFSELAGAFEITDAPPLNAELLSILHMMKFPEKKDRSFFSKIGTFFGKAPDVIRAPEGFETAKKYALQAAKGGRLRALHGLLLTQVDLFKVKSLPLSFFQASMDDVADFYEGKAGKPLATLFIEYENTFETLEKFQKAFLIALDLEGFGSSEALEKLMLFYHFSAVTFLRHQRGDLLKEKVLDPLLGIAAPVTSPTFRAMEKWIFTRTLDTFLSLELSLKSKLEEKVKTH